MKIGVPKETAADERRVALTPDVAGRLGKSGLAVLVERGAGEAASFGDEAYQAAGATVVPAAAALFRQSDVVLKVQPPSRGEVRLCREGAALVAVFQPSAARDAVAALAARKVTAFSLALLPRITRAQAMDVLSSQATVAGYKAVLLAAAAAGRLFPMLVTAAGTLAPAGVLILGPANLPSTVPYHASQMYARNVSSFLLHVTRDGTLVLDFDDEITRDTCVTHAGEVRKP